MQYLFYCAIYFKVQGITEEVFVVNVVGVTLAKCGVFTNQHTQDVKVVSTRYRKAIGIPSPSNSDIDNP
jgi:hypothetical protein